MLDLQKLRTFCAVVLRNNFTKAASELGYCQSSVTAQIKVLEKELGAQVFARQRFSKELVLTEAGRTTFEYARRLLALAEEAKAAVRQVQKSHGTKRLVTDPGT